MFSLLRSAPIWVTGLLGLASASPVEVVQVIRPYGSGLGARAAADLAAAHLDKRLSADFDISKSWNHDVLFSHGISASQDQDQLSSFEDGAPGSASEAAGLEITCVECYTKGTVTASLHDNDIIDPIVRLDFHGVEAYLDIDIETTMSATYTLNLFTSNSPIGLGYPGVSVGVVLYVDLVFSLSCEIDVEAGFVVQVAEGSYIEANIFGGDIKDTLFDGLSSHSLPVTVKTGSGVTFKADLRVRVQAGAEVDGWIQAMTGIGAGAELAVYANLIEFVAILDTTETCALQSMEYWDLNVGAYAHLDVVVDYSTQGLVPTISTTVMIAPTQTQCWITTSSTKPAASTTTAAIVQAVTTSATTLRTSSVVAISTSTIASLSSSESMTSSQSVMTAVASTITQSPDVPETGTTGFIFPIGNSTAFTNGTTATATLPSSDALVTSTIYSTTTYTITSCAANVVNCPKSYQSEIIVTKTVDAFTTICPATAVITSIPSSASASAPAALPVADEEVAAPLSTTIVQNVVILTAMATPVVATFAQPVGPPPSASPVVAASSVSKVLEMIIATSARLSSAGAASTGFPFVGAVDNVAKASVGASTNSTISRPTGTGASSPAASTSGTPVTAGAEGLHAVSGVGTGSALALLGGVVAALFLL